MKMKKTKIVKSKEGITRNKKAHTNYIEIKEIHKEV